MHYNQQLFSAGQFNFADVFTPSKTQFIYASPVRLLGYDLASFNMYRVLSYFTDAVRFNTRTLNLCAGNNLCQLFSFICVQNGTVFATGTQAGLPLLYYILNNAGHAQYLAWINLGS